MKLYRILLASVLLLAVLLSAVACTTDGNQSDDSVPAGNDSSEEIIDETKTFPYPDYYADKTIRIMCVDKSRHTYGELQFVPDDESSYTAVSAAVRARNDLIEQKYGLTIELHPVKYPVTELRTLIESNLPDIDLVCDSVDYMVQSVTENYFWSVDTLMDTTKAWWDTDAMRSLSIGNRTYFLCGDALITDDDNTYLYLFNKEMYSANRDLQEQFGDIYDLVRAGDFTLDNFSQMCKLVSKPDENGQWGFTATYGNLSHAYGATIMVNGCNLAMADIDDNTGYFQLNVDSPLGISVFESVYEIMSDKANTQRAELIIGQGDHPSTYGFSELQDMFIGGRGLFYNTTSSSISILKTLGSDVSFDFGVLPIPKYNKAQEKYCNAVNRYQSSVLGIPTINSENLEATCVLLQALGCYSQSVKDAYYSQTLQLQALTDNADAEMLDLIYSNRFYDLGSMFNWGNGALIGFYGGVIANDSQNTVVSAWDAISDKVTNDMQATVDAYKSSIT